MNQLLHRDGAPPKQVKVAVGNSFMEKIHSHDDDVCHPLPQETYPLASGELGATATEKSKISKWQWEHNGTQRKHGWFDPCIACAKTVPGTKQSECLKLKSI